MTRRLHATVLSLVVTFVCARVQAGDWQTLSAEEGGLPGNEIQYLAEREDGSIWIGTLSGLGLYRDGNVTVVLDGGRVWDVLDVATNEYWIGTGKGAVHVTPDGRSTSATEYAVAPILRRDGETLWALFKTRDGAVSVHARDGDGWSPVEAFADERVLDMMQARDGALWISVEGNGVFEVPPGGDPAAAVRHLEGRHVSAMFEASDGRMCCGSWGAGLFVRDDGAWQRHLEREESAVIALDEDAAGRLWVGTSNNGLWRQTEGGWEHDLQDEGGINMLAATSGGKVWISTQMQGGLRYWNGEGWVVSLDSPFPISSLIETRGGAIWAGGVLDGVHVLKAGETP